jgi:ABC-2 type transport system permease protein
VKQFGKIFKFELKNYAKNKAFVGITIFLMAVIAIVMFFPRITALFESDDTSVIPADFSVMLVKADDITQADMVKETFAASFTEYDV